MRLELGLGLHVLQCTQRSKAAPHAPWHSWLGLGLGLGSGLGVGVGVGLDAHLRHRVGRQGSLLLNYYRLLNY